MVFQKSPVVRSREFFCFLENRPYLKDMTPPPRPLSPTRKATSIPSRRPPLRRRKLRLWMRPYSVPGFWRMIDDGEKRPTLPPPHLFDLWITILASRNIPYLLTGRGNKLPCRFARPARTPTRSGWEAVLPKAESHACLSSPPRTTTRTGYCQCCFCSSSGMASGCIGDFWPIFPDCRICHLKSGRGSAHWMFFA